MVMVQLFKISGIILALLLAGCTKDDELKLPVKTQLILQFQPMHSQYPPFDIEIWPFLGIEEGHYLDYSGGIIGIQKIEFEGIREAGENVFFETDPDMNLPITEYLYNNRTPIFAFDLPQGVYKYMRVDVYLKSIDEAAFESYVGEDKPDAGLLLEGCYKHVKLNWNLRPEVSWDSIAVEIAIDPGEKFDFRTFHDEVIKQPDCEILLLFDLNYAFATIDLNSFEEAEISGDSLDRKIIISSNHNTDLYEILSYRLGHSTGMFVY